MVGQTINLERSIISSGLLNSKNIGPINISSTIGQVFTTTLSNSNLTLTQGFHQSGSIIISNNNSIEDFNLSLDVSIYPNPAINNLYVKIQSTGINQRFRGEIFDVFGRRVLLLGVDEYLLTDYQYEIDFSNFQSGYYFLRIYEEEGNNYKDFKIVKVE